MEGSFGFNDAYAEASVKKVKMTTENMIKTLCVLVDIALLLGALLFNLSFLIAIFLICVILTVVAFQYLSNIEYEVVYVNGQFDFARIMNGSHRRQLLRMDLDSSEILAPAKSHAVDSYNSSNKYTTKNFTSGKPDANVYVLFGKDSKKGTLIKAEFEPTEKMLALIKGNPTFRRKLSE